MGGPPPGGGYGPPPPMGGYGPPPGGGYGPPPGPPPGGGYGPPPGAPPGGGYGPPPGGGYGPPPGGGYGPPPPMGGSPFGGPPMGGPMMGGMPPPKKSGPSVALIAIIGVVAFCVIGLGGCLLCFSLAKPDKTPTVASGPSNNTPAPTPTAQKPDSQWITVDHPYVKFMAPPGWTTKTEGGWGVFKPADGQAVYAFTTFSRPGESTVKLGAAAGVLGLGEVNWTKSDYTNVGQESFSAHYGEGTCNFHGPNGYIWYATVDPGRDSQGNADQILLIYTVNRSAASAEAHKQAVVASIRSLQRR